MNHMRLGTVGKFICAMSSLFVFSGLSASWAATPQAVNGVLDLTTIDFRKTGPLRLDGMWEVYPGEFIDFIDINQTAPSKRQVKVGSLWNGVRLPFLSHLETRSLFPAIVDMLPNPEIALPAQGVATYRLTLVSTVARDLSVRLPAVGTASELTLDGKRIVESDFYLGVDGRARASSFPSYGQFKLPSGTSTLLWYVANQEHVRGGPWDVPSFALPDAMDQERRIRIATEMVIMGILLATAGFLGCSTFAGRVDNSAAWLSVSALALACYSGVSGEGLFGQIFQFTWLEIMRLKYASIFLGISAFLISVRRFASLPYQIISWLTVAIAAGCTVVTFTQPALIFGDLAVPFIIWIIVATGVNSVGLLAQSIHDDNRPLVGLLSIGIGAVSFTVAGLSLFGLVNVAVPMGQIGAVFAVLFMALASMLKGRPFGSIPSSSGFVCETTSTAIMDDREHNQRQKVFSLSEFLKAKILTNPPDRRNAHPAGEVQDQTHIPGAAKNMEVNAPASVHTMVNDPTDFAMAILYRESLDFVTDGVLIVNPEHTVVHANARFRHHLDLPMSITRAGTPFADLAIFMARRGDLGRGEAEIVAQQTIAEFARDLPKQSTLVTDDGRVLSLWPSPMQDGSIIFICTDQTPDLAQKWYSSHKITVASNGSAKAPTNVVGAEDRILEFVEGIDEAPRATDADGNFAKDIFASDGASLTEKQSTLTEEETSADELDQTAVESHLNANADADFIPQPLLAPATDVPLGSGATVEILDLTATRNDDEVTLEDMDYLSTSLELAEDEEIIIDDLPGSNEDAGRINQLLEEFGLEESALPFATPSPEMPRLRPPPESYPTEPTMTADDHPSEAKHGEQNMEQPEEPLSMDDIANLLGDDHENIKSEPKDTQTDTHNSVSVKDDPKPKPSDHLNAKSSRRPFVNAIDPNRPKAINAKTLETIFGAHMDQAADLVNEQLANTEIQLRDLEAAVLTADKTTSRQLCRTIKSASRALGLDELVSAISGVESALSSDAWLDATHAVHSAQDARSTASAEMTEMILTDN